MKKFQIVVIGAGAGGLVVAIGASRANKRVLLIEAGTYGGDCTNFGCIPSKALIASAEAGYYLNNSHELGFTTETTIKSADGVLKKVQEKVSFVLSHEDSNALAKIGVETLTGKAHFVDSHILRVGNEEITFDKAVIAAGSSPLVPAIEGLKETPFLTNETIFSLPKVPQDLIVLGGGPIGSELAQAFARLGAKVTQIHRGSHLLKKEEIEAAEVIEKQFAKEKITLLLQTSPKKIDYQGGKFIIDVGDRKVTAEQLLVSVGRVPNVESLQLEAASITYDKRGIKVDKYGRTSQKHIFAVGDITGGPQFTHAAENQARTVLTTLLLPFKSKLSKEAMPRCTYTDPEIASAGLLQKEAEALYGAENIASYKVPFSQNDRAITASREEGFVKVITKKLSSRILGCTIVGPRAGEMLPELTLAMKHKIPLRKIAKLIHPYPTYNLAIRKAADLWLTETFLPFIRNPFKGINYKRFIPIALILTLMLVAYFTGVYKYISFEMLKEKHAQLRSFVASFPYSAPLLFMLLYAVVVTLSLPGGALLSLIGGFLFPIPYSTIYVVIGATLGAAAIFMAAKTAFYDFLKKKAGPFLKKMEKGFQKNAASYLLFLRFVPLFPFWLVNIAPAFFGVSFITYLWTTFIGIIPGAYVYTQTGEGLATILENDQPFSFETLFNVKLRIALLALGLFALLPIVIKKILQKRKKKDS